MSDKLCLSFSFPSHRRVNVGERDQPLLPDGHLKNGSAVFLAFVQQNGQVGKEKTFYVENADRLFRIPGREEERRG